MPNHTLPSARGLDRRLFLQALLGTGAALGLSACASGATAGAALSTSAPLPTTVPSGTSLAIASDLGAQELQLKLAGLLDNLPFKVSGWPSIGAGPDVINAARGVVPSMNVNLPWSPNAADGNTKYSSSSTTTTTVTPGPAPYDSKGMQSRPATTTTTTSNSTTVVAPAPHVPAPQLEPVTPQP